METNTKTKLKLYFTAALLLFVVFGLIHLGASTIIDPGRVDLFNRSGLPGFAVRIWGGYTIVSMLVMAHPRTFVIGCILLLLNNLFTIGNYLKAGSVGGAALEGLAMGIPVLLLWAGHPYTQWKQKRGTPDEPSGGEGERQ